MKKLFIYVVGALFLFASCESENLENEAVLGEENDVILMQAVKSFNNQDLSMQPSKAAKNFNANRVTKDLIFKYSRGTFSVVPNPGYCGDFIPPLQFVIEGDGIASHIGRFTVQNFACVAPDGNFLSPLYGFITAANGDIINSVLNESYPDEENPPFVYYQYDIIGGSEGGRFEGATGYITLYGLVDQSKGTFDFEGWGEITY